MALEHRWSRRRQACLDAFIFHRLPGLLRARIHNISLDGVFIAVEYFALPPQAVVELSFALEVAGKPIIHQLEAFVIHSNYNGYGMMFKDYRPTAFLALRDTLYAEKQLFN